MKPACHHHLQRGAVVVSVAALLTRIMNEVPLVVGVKQSAGDLKLFADL
jgi:hypothetical protein